MASSSPKAIPFAIGVIEGACRHLVQDRMERAGMRRSLEGAQARLDLRRIHISGPWDEFTAHRIRKETERLYPHARNPIGANLRVMRG